MNPPQETRNIRQGLSTRECRLLSRLADAGHQIVSVDDIEDMNVLVQAGLDVEVIRTELDAQIERLGDDWFATYSNEALVELEERYGVRTPLEDRVQELTTRYYQGLEVLQALDEPMTLEELATELDLTPGEIRDRVAYLARLGRVT